MSRLSSFVRSRAFLGVAAILLVILLLGSGVYVRIRGASDSEEGTEAAADSTGPVPDAAATAFATDVALPVSGVAAVRDTLVLSVDAAGTAAAARQTIVSALVAGRITELPVRESEAVGAGALLARIDSTEYQLTVASAQADLRRAQASYQQSTLFNDEIADSATRVQRAAAARAQSGIDQSQATLDKARLDLAHTRVTAPFPGRVASLKVVAGQSVPAGTELMTIVDLNPIRVEVQVLEGEVGYLSPGSTASVTFAAFPGETFTGRVATINPVVETDTRTARVTVLVPNPRGRILPGMYARVSLQTQRYPDRVLVPRTAILERDNRTMLFVYEDDGSGGRAKWRYVTTGLANDSMVEIVPNTETDSVRPGEVVLTDGQYSLIHDARVHLVDDVAAAGGRPQ